MKRQLPQPKDRATLGRKAGNVGGRLLADLKRKTKQAERMLGNAASVSSSAKKKGREAEMLAKDSAKVRATGCHGCDNVPAFWACGRTVLGELLLLWVKQGPYRSTPSV